MWNLITSIPKKRDALHKRICIVFFRFKNEEDFPKESSGQCFFSECVLGAQAARIVWHPLSNTRRIIRSIKSRWNFIWHYTTKAASGKCFQVPGASSTFGTNVKNTFADDILIKRKEKKSNDRLWKHPYWKVLYSDTLRRYKTELISGSAARRPISSTLHIC